MLIPNFDDKNVGKNFENPVFTVKHSDLFRAGESIFRSKCPICKVGVLMMRRGEDGKIISTDNCILCGQQFIYSDFEKFNATNAKSDSGNRIIEI